MRKLLCQLAVYTMALLPASATTYTLNPSQSTSTIQGIINGAAAGDTVVFSAGAYSLTANLTLKCGITYTGPVVSLNSKGMATPTAMLGTTLGLSGHIFNFYSQTCSGSTIVQYIAFLNGGEGIYVQAPSQNMVIQYDSFGGIKYTSGQTTAGIFLDGPNQSSYHTNMFIQWNQIGDSNSCVGENTVVNSGQCNGIVVFASLNGVNVLHNNFFHVSEGVHINCPNYANQQYACEPPGGAITRNVVAQYNDFSNIHRINWEEQPQESSGINFSWNDSHDWNIPDYGSYGASFACCANGQHLAPNLIAANNIAIFNTSGTSRYGYGMEAMGYESSYQNNMVQSAIFSSYAQGMAWGNGGSPQPPNSAFQWTNNYVCGTFSGYPSNLSNYISREGGGAGQGYTPVTTGSNFQGTCAATTSVAPSISPSPGGYSSPLTVTLSDPGYTSGAVALGNTSIYYTTDGSTPSPGGASTKLYSVPVTVTLPATIKAVGMWGAQNQPTSYAAGFGFVPSGVVTANYVASGGVTLSSVSIAPTAGQTTLLIGGTVQMIVICHYSDGSTQGCNTTDSYGNSVTSWLSSNGNVTVSGSGLATGQAIGTAVVTATVTGGFTTSPGTTLTVSANPLTLNSVSLATAGGVTSMTAGSTNQLIATCHYSDGSTTGCNTMDSHGNALTSAHSSAPTIASISSPGALVTGVAAGSTNLSASVIPAPSQLGTSLENVSGYTNNGYINEIYGVTGTASGSYTPVNCHIILPATTWVAGKLWTCLLVLGTPTTQNASALCSNSYTTTGTSWPGGDIVISMASCPALTPDQGYWVGSTTNQTTANPAQGFSNCNGSCSGPAPIFGSGTYAYRYVANTFGNYTSLPTTLNASGGTQQVSQYIELTTTPVTSANLLLSVTMPAPSLVSAYLTASSGSMTVGDTMQMAAKCHYTSGPDQDCTVADIYGDAVSAWVSSDPTKATVNTVGAPNPGLVTAVAAGTPSITATIGTGLSSSAYPITINNPLVTLTGVSLSLTGGVTGLFVGATNQLTATCTYSDESSDDCTTTDAHGNLAYNYVSTTPAHATINATSGLVTGVAPGATTFTAVAGSFTSNALPLNVFPVLSGVYTITVSGPVRFSGTVRF